MKKSRGEICHSVQTKKEIRKHSNINVINKQ